jgi:hypothetical protein
MAREPVVEVGAGRFAHRTLDVIFGVAAPLKVV